MRFLVLSAVLLALSAAPAAAQLIDSSPGKQRAQNRRALRDARKYPADYKDSHLAVSKQNLRTGSSPAGAAPKDGRAEYKFDHTGAAYVKEPIGLGLRHGGKKKKPTND
jgi:hypothetical protein